MLTDEEVERFISKYGEKNRNWVLKALDYCRGELKPFLNPPFTKLDEVKYLLHLKERIAN